MDYPEIVDTIEPRHRFMSAYEQHIEPPDRKWQYLLFAAEPYETIGFKLPSREIDKVLYKFLIIIILIKLFYRARGGFGRTGFPKQNSSLCNFTTRSTRAKLNPRSDFLFH